MPRRSHRLLRAERGADRGVAKGGADRPAGPSGWQQLAHTREGDFLVRTVPGAAAKKGYRCPGCQQIIEPGVAHLVVWPADDGPEAGLGNRRHWHRACWQRRSTRGGPGALPW